MKRGRKARGLLRRWPSRRSSGRNSFEREAAVKAILERFTVAVALLACMALTVGAGIRWS